MNILITGGAGFVGTNLIKALLKKNHNIVSIDNYNTGLRSNHQPGVEYVKYDIRDIDDYNVWGKFDIVYHLAAIARIQPSFDQPEEYFTTNANGTLKLTMYCAKNNIPIIYAGSSSHHAGKFSNPYTFSKDIGEEIIQLFENIYKLKSTITRFYNVYGPGQISEGQYATVIGIFENQIKNNQDLTVVYPGTQTRIFTHIDDIIEGVLLVAKNGDGDGYYLGTKKNISILELVKMFNKNYIFIEPRNGERINSVINENSNKAENELGWFAKIDIEDCIKSFLF